MSFIYPPTFNTGDVLTRANLDVFRRNDEWLSGVADGLRPINRGEWRGFVGAESNMTIYEGWHLLRSDAKMLYYWIFADDGSQTNQVVTKLYYNDVWIDEIGTTSGFQSKAGFYDLSALPPGFYHVECKLYRDEASGGIGGLRAPYTRYTGAKTYTSLPLIYDGLTSTATHFTNFGNNDLYFYDQVPPHPALSGTKADYIGGESSRIIWNGWDRFNEDHYRIWYELYLSTIAGSNKLRVYYDYGGTYQQYMEITSAGLHLSYWDLSTPSNYLTGNYYRVCVELRRTDTGVNAEGRVYWLYATAPARDTAYTPMGLFTPGQWVYGSTAGQTTRLALLRDNDQSIRARLIWSDETTGRQDYAVRIPTYARPGGYDIGEFSFMRRYNLLYYRVKNAVLYWGTDNEHSLDDYDDDNWYHILDLNSIDLPIGMSYNIDGDELIYAAEY